MNRNGNLSLTLTKLQQGDRLDILVENLGRICYGGMPYNLVYKGLLSNVTLGGKVLKDWELFPLPLNNTHQLLSINFEDPAFNVPKVLFQSHK
jgi:hypothetical protein